MSVASVSADVAEDFASAVERVFEASGAPGVSAALVSRDGEALTVCFGLADPDAETPLRPSDRMLTGSVGKTYVSGLLHALAADGALAIGDPLAEHLGDRPWFDRLPNARTLTLRDLLRHQSGLPRYVFDEDLWAAFRAEPDRCFPPEELVAVVLDAEPTSPAGAGFGYSDTNYLLLGMVIEQVTDRAFYDLVRARLLAPLGLEDTVPSSSRRVPGVVQGRVDALQHLVGAERTLADGRFTFCNHFEWCGGGWASTAADLARWIAALASGDALAGDYLPSLFDAVPAPPLGEGTRYGAGVMLWESEAGPVVGHEGIMPGYRAVAGYHPGSERAIAVLLNSDALDGFTRMSDLLLRLFLELGGEAPEDR